MAISMSKEQVDQWKKLKQTIATVQPMTAPVGGIMFYRPMYGSKKDDSEQLRLFDEIFYS
jgi:hypothetical protein